ncbi:MAG: DUF4388 domain-containing protein [Candidatus Brocadiae bacterium]|nr:DUF4388 domain-containing protein [Candidatus Brocadiia bacterium]
MAFQGEVGAIGLADVFGNIAANSLPGTLHVTSDRGEAWLAFEGGALSGFSRGPGRGLSGEEVLQLRVPLAADELDSLVKKKKRTKRSWPEFVESQGTMPADAFRGLLLGELTERAVEVFFWAPAKFEFADGPPSQDLFPPDLSVTIDVNSLLMEAARRRDHWEMINRVIGSPEDVFLRRRSDPPPDSMPEIQKRVLELCNGSNSVAQIETATRGTRFAIFDAVAELARAQMIRPLGPEEMARLADEHLRAARTGEAIRLFRRSLDTEHANAGVREKLAEAYARHGEPAKAAGELKMLAHRSAEQGDQDGAIGWYRKAMSLSPEDLPLREKLVTLLRDAGRRTEAATEALRLAVVARKQLLHDRALTALDAAIEANPDLREALELRLETLLSLGRKTEATRQLEGMAERATTDDAVATFLERALRIEPARTDLKQKIADIRSGRSRRRKTFFRRLLWATAVILLLSSTVAAAGWELRARIRYDAALHASHLDLVHGDYEASIASLQSFAAANPWTLAARSARIEADSIREEAIRTLKQRAVGLPEDQKILLKRRWEALGG